MIYKLISYETEGGKTTLTLDQANPSNTAQHYILSSTPLAGMQETFIVPEAFASKLTLGSCIEFCELPAKRRTT